MSQKMILASKRGYRSIGWRVRAQASEGVWQHSKNECLARMARNSVGFSSWNSHMVCRSSLAATQHSLLPIRSRCKGHSPGRYRPACLMTHTGARSVSSPLAARNNRSFVKGGNEASVSRHVWTPLSWLMGVPAILYIAAVGIESTTFERWNELLNMTAELSTRLLVPTERTSICFPASLPDFAWSFLT